MGVSLEDRSTIIDECIAATERQRVEVDETVLPFHPWRYHNGAIDCAVSEMRAMQNGTDWVSRQKKEPTS